jgi:outer membrane receptor protein involved in Fe transport
MHQKSKLLPRILAVVLCTLTALCLPAIGQTVSATVSGIVTDPSGAVVPNAKITLTNTEQGIVNTMTSNHDGAYTIPNVVPGSYEIKVEVRGFRTEVKKGLTLTVGAQPTINFVLNVASADQSVLVEDVASQIEAGNSALSDVVGGTTIRELPLNARDWTQMAALEPGTAAVRSQNTASNGSSRGNRGYGQQFSISGGRPQYNTYRVDGINVNDYANSAPGSSAGLALGVDAIAEFSVISANYSVTYGQTSGGIINAITRGGTNTFHGSAYEFVRNDKFDAEGYYDATKLPYRRNDFGGTFGGPIIKDKTFIFGNYEGLRQVYTTTTNAVVPSDNARAGQLVAGTVTVNPLVAPYLGFWHEPTGAVTGDTAIYSFASKAFTPENFFTIRGDQVFSQKDSLYATYAWDKGFTTQPDSLNINNQRGSAFRQLLSIAENHVFNLNFYNTIRIGANRVSATSLIKTPGANPLGSDTSLGAVPGLDAPIIAVGSGITSTSGGVVGGSAVNYGFTTPQLYDDVVLVKGKHQLKFGFSLERIQSNILIANYNYGNYTFTSFSNFLQNIPKTLTIAVTPPTAIDLRQSVYGAYAEDNWKITPQLNLTAGVRYEPVEVPTETKNRLVNLNGISGLPVLGSPLFSNPSYKNFEPRVGFSYSPTATHGKTVVSGGVGIFDVLPTTWLFNLQLSQVGPYSEVLANSSLAPGSFPTAAVAATIGGSGAPNESFIQNHPPVNYIEQFNLTIEQQLAHKLNVKIGYVGSHGVDQQVYTSDANVPVPTLNTKSTLVFPCGANATPDLTCTTSNAANKINQNSTKVGQILGSGWYTNSEYNGLLASLKQDVGKSLHWMAAFTWQKSYDGSSSVTSGTPFANSLNTYLFHPLYGVSDYNIPRVFVANMLWDTPKLVDNKYLGILVNGWQMGAIYQLSDGAPFTMVISGDNLDLGNGSPLDFPDRITNIKGCKGNPVNPHNRADYVDLNCFVLPVNTTGAPGTRFGNEQRNSLRGPDFNNLDFSLVKNFPTQFMGESSYLQFRAEAFNIANHPNLAPPFTTNSFSVASGALVTTNTSTGTLNTTQNATPRQIQLGAKLVF